MTVAGARAIEKIVVVDFGSQYSQLIARRVRECQVYCELIPWNAPAERFEAARPQGFILSGGPASVYAVGAPSCPPAIRRADVPILGICYGMQIIAHAWGGTVSPSTNREFGPASVSIQPDGSKLFAGLPSELAVWMSHGDRITEIPSGFEVLAQSSHSPIAAMGRDSVFGLQFHPEVVHTPLGREIIRNFVVDICHCSPSWTPARFIESAIEQVRTEAGNGRAVCAMSGGVDSTVAAILCHRALGDRLTCIFVNNGLLRQGEAEQVIETARLHLGSPLRYVDASERFLSRLDGVTDPEQKRRIIGEEFIRVFEAEARDVGDVHYLVQGTLYPDVIESAPGEARAAAVIKSHHNVGGLPARMGLKLIEPLRYLFKDEVRAAGLELGLPSEVVWRHPFPGPGLAVRVLGSITPERLELARRADAIFIEELRTAKYYGQVAQALAVLTPLQTVGVMGDDRTYSNVVALRAVTTDDFMTADWARLPHDLIARIASRIVNEISGINRVVYDVTSKPPGTIEWE